jgi:hypothetical protein
MHWLADNPCGTEGASLGGGIKRFPMVAVPNALHDNLGSEPVSFAKVFEASASIRRSPVAGRATGFEGEVLFLA